MWDRFFQQRAYIGITPSRMRWYVRKATRGWLLMWDNIFGVWLYSFENESWIVVSQEKILCWIFSDLSRPSTWFKSKTAHFYLQPVFNALNMPRALRLTLSNLLCWALSDRIHRGRQPWRCKNTPHTHTFFSTKWLTRVTVADKLVLVNPFWWKNHLFIAKCAVCSLFQVDLSIARHWL